jgi:hypothetical protein
MTTAKKTSAKRRTKTSATKTAGRKASKSQKGNPCWPGFEPALGKKPGTKGSCKPEPGRHSKATKRATQKAAAASKLEKAGKPNPKTKR